MEYWEERITMHHDSRRSGQALLMVLLIMALASTIALALISQSTVDVNITEQLEESAQALNAAEAGVERVLESGAAAAGSVSENITYDATTTAFGGNSGVYTYPHFVSEDSVATIWLASQDQSTSYQNSQLTLCWESGVPVPAVAISLFYRTSGGEYRVSRAAYDSASASRTGPANNFSAPTGSSGGCGLDYQYKTLDLSNPSATGLSPAVAIDPVLNRLLMLRVRPVYAGVNIAVETAGGTALPAQGSLIESTGQTLSGITRKVQVYQEYPSPLSVFDAVVLSQNSFMQ